MAEIDQGVILSFAVPEGCKKLLGLTPKATLKMFADNRTLDNLFPSLICLLRIYFALPCTTCEAGRLLSALHRIKNYLRSIMTEHRFNSCCLICIDSTVTDELNVKN